MFFSLFAYSGYMAGEKDLRKISTKYFDIIFPQTSAETAYILSQKADEIEEKICSDLGLTPWFRMPVIITTATDSFNAYFTTASQNHIVLFDTLPETDMLVFGDTIVNTFTHELTHAITANMLSRSIKYLTAVFGEALNVGYSFFLPKFIIEGAAVAQESKAGEGRLNDAYYWHKIKQAKLSGVFPHWWDVSGSRDVFPGGSMAYSFGGPFTQYIQNEYGMVDYTMIWYRADNFITWSIWEDFKKVYGISLSDVWNNFYDSIEVPDVSAEPLEHTAVSNFFDKKIMNEKGSRYVMLTRGNQEFVYLDQPAQCVYKVHINSDGSTSRPEKLFSMKNINSLRLSSDDSLLAVGYYDINHPAVKKSVKIYSLKNNSWLNINETGLGYPCIFKDSGQTYLAAVKSSGQKNSIKIYRLSLNKKEKPESYDFLKEIKLPDNNIVLELNDGGNGRIVCLCHNMEGWFIESFEKLYENQVIEKSVSFGKDIRLHDLNVHKRSENGFSCSFSYAVNPDGFPRLGLYDFSTNICTLMNEDISGGVYYPVVLSDSKAVYSGFFTDNYKLFNLDINQISFENVKAALSERNNSALEEHDNFDLEQFISASSKYNKPFLKGYWYPAVTGSKYKNLYSDSSRGLGYAGNFVIGVTGIMENPWNSENLTASAGFDIKSKSGIAGLTYRLNNETSVFSFMDSAGAAFYKNGLLQAYNDLSISTGWRAGNYSSLVLRETNSAFTGKSYYEVVNNRDLTDYIYDKNQISLAFSTIKADGSGLFENSGIRLMVAYNAEYLSSYGERSEYNLIDGTESLGWKGPVYQNMSLSASIELPKLIPIYSRSGFTYNLPLIADCSLYPAADVLLGIEAQTVLFDWEIQKGLGYFPVYMNRLMLTGEYDIYWKKKNSSFAIMNIMDDLRNLPEVPYMDAVTASLCLNGNFNYGNLSLENGYTASVNFSYFLHSEKNNGSRFRFSFDNRLKF